jgi:Putative metallopeptidase
MRTVLALVLAALALAACGSSENEEPQASRTPTATPEKKHVIKVVYDEPQNQTEQVAKELLSVGGTDGVAQGFSQNFKFPVDLKIHAQSGNNSPFYDPSTKTINLFYGFVDQTGAILREGQPDITDEEFGKQIAAVSSFILVHELGHAFVDVFDIPITGREEDAVDGMATIFYTDAVPNGLEYAFDAARFFKLLQDVQGPPNINQFADEHSLSVQRSFDIVCSVAGASEESLQQVAELGILPERRLARCPAEYQQKSKAWKTLLEPHLRKRSKS